jgi:nitric oxide synthase oxygenase domain/subunit
MFISSDILTDIYRFSWHGALMISTIYLQIGGRHVWVISFREFRIQESILSRKNYADYMTYPELLQPKRWESTYLYTTTVHYLISTIVPLQFVYFHLS